MMKIAPLILLVAATCIMAERTKRSPVHARIYVNYGPRESLSGAGWQNSGYDSNGPSITAARSAGKSNGFGRSFGGSARSFGGSGGWGSGNAGLARSSNSWGSSGYSGGNNGYSGGGNGYSGGSNGYSGGSNGYSGGWGGANLDSQDYDSGSSFRSTSTGWQAEW